MRTSTVRASAGVRSTIVPSLRVRPAATRCHCDVPCGRCCKNTRWSATGSPDAVRSVPLTPTRWLKGTRTRPGFAVRLAGGGLAVALGDGVACGADDAGGCAWTGALAVGAGLLTGWAAAGAGVVRGAAPSGVGPATERADGTRGCTARGRDASDAEVCTRDPC